MPGEFVGVRVNGITEITRGLRAVDRDLPRELQGDMEAAATRTVLPVARSLTPRVSGRLAGSERVGRYRTGVAIQSTLPYANVIHWGGTTGRGHRPGVPGSGSVKVTGSQFASRAAEQRMEAFAQQLADALDAFFSRHGLR